VDVDLCWPDLYLVAPVKLRPPAREPSTIAIREERLQQLYLEHAVNLRRYARRCGVPGHDVDDVVADVFLVAWRKLESIPSPPDDRLWLLGVARNLVAKQQERFWHRLHLMERLRGSAHPQGFESAPDHAALREAIRRLPRTERDVVRLVEWEGLSHDEAALVMGCSPNASRLRLHRAKARLRRMLGGDEGEAALGTKRKEGSDG
jgi:RNA polymerase sigma factor (sigma-70 family)